MKRIFILLLALTGVFAVAQQHTERVYLSGRGADEQVMWDFKVDKGMQAGVWSKIAVPSCWELQGFGQYQYGMKFYGKAFPDGVADETGYYKHEFFVPAEWRNRQIEIVFEASMTDTEVKINGQKAGAVHQGAFYRFSYNISERVKFGATNLLEVTVAKESTNAGVNLAERRADYWNFGGIFRPVFLEVKPAVHVQNIAIDAGMSGRFRFRAGLNRAGVAKALNVEIFGPVSKGGHDPLGVSGRAAKKPASANQNTHPAKALISKTFQLKEGSDAVLAELQLANPECWTAETPTLYKAVFSLTDDNGNIIHTENQTFGFRSIEVRESDGLYINGVKVNIRGVNRHSFRPETGRTLSRQFNIDDVELIKSMNMNAVRLSHYPADPEFLATCDSLGLYVMNELGGWHGKYDTPTGTGHIRSMVERDQNHPSVIWWANGNEKGWNTELDAVFGRFDLQQRPVLHPQGNFGGFETMHYRSYGESQEYMRLPEIFMPTEFLHGLYDGGHGAGLYDYWEMMRSHPRCAGGFLWVLADEGVKRTDKDGYIDNMGNYGADGIVGPHHEKEGSYYTVKEIWNPVQIVAHQLENEVGFTIENRYNFLNINTTRFEWQYVNFPDIRDEKGKKVVVKQGTCKGPDIAPGTSGMLKTGTPAAADALFLTAYDYRGKELWRWTYRLKNGTAKKMESLPSTLPLWREDSVHLTVSTHNQQFIFSKKEGVLTQVKIGQRTINLGNGPRFVAARRADRSFDQFYNHDDEHSRQKERTYTRFEDAGRFTGFTISTENNLLKINASYRLGNLQEANWTIHTDGTVELDYRYNFNAVVDLMGIQFDYPEEKMQSKRWLGKGPYRVWQNRLQGPVYDWWQTDYNDPVPGESFTYPEFKGYFAGVEAMHFTTAEGEITLYNETPESYIGVYQPRDGRDRLLYTLPETGISVLNVIPAVRNKVNTTDLIGPSSQPVWAKGDQTGRIILKFR